MTSPFTFDPRKVKKDTSYEGGCRWHTYSYPLFCGREIQASGEDSTDVMEALERKFDESIGFLTESEMIEISKLLKARKLEGDDD